MHSKNERQCKDANTEDETDPDDEFDLEAFAADMARATEGFVGQY